MSPLRCHDIGDTSVKWIHPRAAVTLRVRCGARPIASRTIDSPPNGRRVNGPRAEPDKRPLLTAPACAGRMVVPGLKLGRAGVGHGIRGGCGKEGRVEAGTSVLGGPGSWAFWLG